LLQAVSDAEQHYALHQRIENMASRTGVEPVSPP
jgi:hypothetical protein